MILRHIYLQNYRVYEGVTEFDMPDGLVGIYGPNGAGKSYLIEAIPFALYGYCRGSVEEVRTTGVNDECVVEVTFEHEGHSYTARRTIKGGGKTTQRDATISADGLQMASGAREVERYVQQLIGMNERGFLASVFAEQKQLAALSSQTPAERRKLVLDLLGITPIETAVKTVRADARDTDKLLKELQGLVVDLDALETERDDAAVAVVAAGAEAADAEAALGAAQKLAEKARADLDAIAKAIEEGKQVAGRFAELEKRFKSLSETVEAIAAARSEAATLGDTAARLDAARRLLDLARALTDTAAAKTRAEKALAVFGDISPETEPPDDADAVKARAVAATASSDAASLAATAKAMKARSDEAEANLIRTDALEGDAECPTCGQALGDSFAAVRAHRVGEVDATRKQFDQADKAARQAQKTAAEAAHLADVADKALTAAKQEWQRQAAARAEQADVQAAVRTATTAFDRARQVAADAGVADTDLASVHAAFTEAEAADRRASTLQGQLAGAVAREAELADVTTERDTVGAELEQRRAAAKERGHTATGLQHAHDAHAAATQAARDAQQRHTNAVAAAATATERAHQKDIQFERAKENNARIKPTADEALLLGRLSELLNAFKDHEAGSVGPRLAGHARALFDQMTDGVYNGLDLTENFEVRLTDANRTFDLRRFSGSEVDLANLALRIAISECVTLQSGGAVGLLVLDEVFGPLDHSRRTRLLEALTNLETRFRQVLVVTHADDVKAQLPSAIEVKVTGERRATAVVV
ncbi:MAG: SMC family ATPase [Acidimicrobiales bacterium]|nr:SMC family ATPase [Acidimicrobiales bacterium]